MSARSGAPRERSGPPPERGGSASAAAPTDLLDGLFDPAVRWAASAIDADPGSGPAAEQKLVARAVPRRRREFAQGRELARRLLGEIGIETDVLLRDPDRVPLWPAGAVGCISHTEGLCAVAVARVDSGEDDGITGVGLDVEGASPLEAALRVRVCTEAERDFLERGDEARAGELGKAVFSVKECVYKACFPTLRERWGFHDLEVELDAEAGRFLATPRVGALARHVLAGRIVQRMGWWLAALTWRCEAGLEARVVCGARGPRS